MQKEHAHNTTAFTENSVKKRKEVKKTIFFLLPFALIFVVVFVSVLLFLFAIIGECMRESEPSLELSALFTNTSARILSYSVVVSSVRGL